MVERLRKDHGVKVRTRGGGGDGGLGLLGAAPACARVAFGVRGGAGAEDGPRLGGDSDGDCGADLKRRRGRLGRGAALGRRAAHGAGRMERGGGWRRRRLRVSKGSRRTFNDADQPASIRAASAQGRGRLGPAPDPAVRGAGKER